MHAHSGIWFSRRKARVEIIPLIDVIFFLLATFVLFTLSLNRIRSVPVTFPFPGKTEIVPGLLNLQVSGDGAVYWNKELIDVKELPVRLEVYKKQTDDPRVFVSGDEHARLGAMVGVLDQVRKSGIEKFSIETRPRVSGK